MGRSIYNSSMVLQLMKLWCLALQRWDFLTFHGAEDLSRINSSPARAAGWGRGEDLIRLKSSEFKNLASVFSLVSVLCTVSTGFFIDQETVEFIVPYRYTYQARQTIQLNIVLFFLWKLSKIWTAIALRHIVVPGNIGPEIWKFRRVYKMCQ